MLWALGDSPVLAGASADLGLGVGVPAAPRPARAIAVVMAMKVRAREARQGSPDMAWRDGGGREDAVVGPWERDWDSAGREAAKYSAETAVSQYASLGVGGRGPSPPITLPGNPARHAPPPLSASSPDGGAGMYGVKRASMSVLRPALSVIVGFG